MTRLATVPSGRVRYGERGPTLHAGLAAAGLAEAAGVAGGIAEVGRAGVLRNTAAAGARA